MTENIPKKVFSIKTKICPTALPAFQRHNCEAAETLDGFEDRELKKQLFWKREPRVVRILFKPVEIIQSRFLSHKSEKEFSLKTPIQYWDSKKLCLFHKIKPI